MMQIRCTNCAGDVPVGQSTREVVCPFCQTMLFVGRQEGIPHFIMSSHLTANDGILALRRYLSQKEITLPLKVVEQTELYLPYWQLQFKKGRPTELVCAYISAIDELNAHAPGEGETGLKSAEDVPDHQLVEPQLQLEEALAAAHCARRELREDRGAALLHIPFVKIGYEAAGEILEAYVDLVDGSVYADLLPPSPQKQKSRALSLVAAIALLLVSLAVALLPGLLIVFAMPLLLLGLYLLIVKLLAGMGW